MIKRLREWRRKLRFNNPDLGLYIIYAFLGLVVLLKLVMLLMRLQIMRQFMN